MVCTGTDVLTRACEFIFFRYEQRAAAQQQEEKKNKNKNDAEAREETDDALRKPRVPRPLGVWYFRYCRVVN